MFMLLSNMVEYLFGSMKMNMIDLVYSSVSISFSVLFYDVF